MKTITTTLVILFTLTALPVHAEEQCEHNVKVQVNGLVCDFCARALEKVFGKRDEVAGINVDLDNAQVTIELKPDQSLDDALVKELITDAGYNVTSVERGC